MWGSPINNEPKEKPSKKKEVIEKPPKKKKCPITKTAARTLLGIKGTITTSQCEWVERWLTQLMRERSLPPQICSENAFGILSQFLSHSDCLDVLQKIRTEFSQLQPTRDESEEGEFDFLLSVVESYPEHQNQSPPSSYNTLK